jgi:hypothetical protein
VQTVRQPNPSAGTPAYSGYQRDAFLDSTRAASGLNRSPQDFQAQVMGILKKYEYGPNGLAQAAPELRALGIGVQQASDGAYRGRLYLPDGRTVDVIDPKEGMDWWNNKTGTAWGWTDRGVEHPSGPPALSLLEILSPDGQNMLAVLNGKSFFERPPEERRQERVVEEEARLAERRRVR